MQTFWKVSTQSGNFYDFPDNMEGVHNIRKVYRPPVNFLDNQ